MLSEEGTKLRRHVENIYRMRQGGSPTAITVDICALMELYSEIDRLKFGVEFDRLAGGDQK